jgi:secreted trypsin-like serine protease
MWFEIFLSLLCASAQAESPKTPFYPEFKNAVLIKSILDNGNIGFCSGVVLSQKIVLTAAHCIDQNIEHKIQVPGRFYLKYVFASKAVRSSQYQPTLSKSDADIGVLEFAAPLPFKSITLCKDQHAHETLYRVGFGGRKGKNLRQIFTLQSASIGEHGVQLATDIASVSGDSGGPIFAIESGEACLYAIHSSIGLQNIPKQSFNPIIQRTLLPVLLEKTEQK